MSLELICILGKKENAQPLHSFPLSRSKVWEAIEREIELPSINGGQTLVLSNGSKLIRVRAYTRWSFADGGETTEFWSVGFQEPEDFVPSSMLEEFCSAYDVTEDMVNVALSYGKATLKAGDVVRDFVLSDYMSALSSEPVLLLTEEQRRDALSRVRQFKARGEARCVSDGVEQSFVHMAQGGDGSAAMMGDIRGQFYKDYPDEFFQFVCDSMTWEY